MSFSGQTDHLDLKMYISYFLNEMNIIKHLFKLKCELQYPLKMTYLVLLVIITRSHSYM